jgi:cobalt-zinc-cadmium efflux system outer membrane protein
MTPINFLRACTVASLCLLGSAQAASLREAFEHAWRPNAEQYSAKAEQYAAQLAASRAWTPAPPSLGLFGTTDQLNSNLGRREWEAELSTPLWLPGQREQAGAVASADQGAFAQRSALARWQLAGQLRETWWALRFAQSAVTSANQAVDGAEQLAKDISRRVKAGDLSPLDANRAKFSLQQAKKDRSQAQLQLARAEQEFALISRNGPLPDRAETLQQAPASEHNPLLSSVAAELRSAQERLQQALGDSRSAPDLSLTYTSERDDFDAVYRDRVKLGITIPFGSEARNRPLVSAANADWIAAQTLLTAERQRSASAVVTAQIELRQSREAEQFAREQNTLAIEQAGWVSKGFALGQFELSALLRSQQEMQAAAAELALSRLTIERAISRVNQAAGVLP